MSHRLVTDFDGTWWVIPSAREGDWERVLTAADPERTFTAPDWALKLEMPQDIEFQEFRVLGDTGWYYRDGKRVKVIAEQ